MEGRWWLVEMTQTCQLFLFSFNRKEISVIPQKRTCELDLMINRIVTNGFSKGLQNILFWWHGLNYRGRNSLNCNVSSKKKILPVPNSLITVSKHLCILLLELKQVLSRKLESLGFPRGAALYCWFSKDAFRHLRIAHRWNYQGN